MPVKMPHSNFKERSQEFNTGVGKCPCVQTFEYTSERDTKMKLRISNLPKITKNDLILNSTPENRLFKIGIPTKATTLREQQLNEAERMKKVHN